MAWNDTYVYSAFEVLTASNLNTYSSENLDYLKDRLDDLVEYNLEIGIPVPPEWGGAIEVPFDCTVVGWSIYAPDGETGSIVVDVLKSNYAGYPPTSSIAGSEKPTISSGTKGQDLSLSTWSSSLSKGDILTFEVESAEDITFVLLSIRVERAG